jgi:hypothetical protein
VTGSVSDLSPSTATLGTVFGRLFENEFATLDNIAISRRLPTGMQYMDQSVALDCWLLDREVDASFEPASAATYALHETAYELIPDARTVISGWSRHLRALLLEDMALPSSTSMMRKRGVTSLGEHLVAPDTLVGPALTSALTQARDRTRQNGMKHVLLVATNGLVVVAGANPYETMAHWHNVEFAARIECMRLEEAAVIKETSSYD